MILYANLFNFALSNYFISRLIDLENDDESKLKMAIKNLEFSVGILDKIKTAKNNQLEKIPVTLWSLSKIKTPNFSYIKNAKKSIFKNGFTISEWPDAKNYALENITLNNDLITLKSSNEFPQKIGVDAKNWVASYINNNLFVESFEFDESATYPDFGTSVTIFGNKLFSELEVLSPEKHLKIGESIKYTIKWNLIKKSCKEEAEKYLQQLP